MSVCIVVTGSLVEGFECIGTFRNEVIGVNFANDNCAGDWWVVPLKHPEAYCEEQMATVKVTDTCITTGSKKKKKVKRLRAKLAAAQAKIDELMLEYCPNEMTEKQLKLWGDNQRAVTVDEHYTDLIIRGLDEGVSDTGTMINTAAHVNARMFEGARAIERLRDVEKRVRDDYMQACSTIARMHAAAIGRVDGPEVGVIEDVAKVREDKLLLHRLLVSTYADLVELHIQRGGFLFRNPVVEQAIEDTKEKA